MHIGITLSRGFSNPGSIKLKPPADATDFQKEFIEQIRRGTFDFVKKLMVRRVYEFRMPKSMLSLSKPL
ncbi:hypothetical protein [Bacillus norwichensis]|uniref:Uncharacterized protein n=1 Tax=Bacillus norwichensis TaxID=2762217 RepID=A0ABR8VJR6_9BACI|nr:hypothetical protein [Bacillus norwichensis]MBD8005009.1 hypothetical protein [Bacillus norwichensis]